MLPATSNAIRRLHSLLQKVAEEVAAIRPLLEEEAESRKKIAAFLNGRLDLDPRCSVTYQADLDASVRADVWVEDVRETIDSLADYTSALKSLAVQAELAAWMLANRSSVFELSSDDDSRVYALAAAARTALPAAPRYALDATARAVLALPADVAYPVEVANG